MVIQSDIAIDNLLHAIKDKSDYWERAMINSYTVGYLNMLLITIHKASPEARAIIDEHTNRLNAEVKKMHRRSA